MCFLLGAKPALRAARCCSLSLHFQCLLVWRSQPLVCMQAHGDTFLSLSKSDVCGAHKGSCLQSYWPKSRDAGIASSDELVVPCLLFSTGASPSCIRRKCQEKWNNRQWWSNLLVDGSRFPVLESQLLNSVVLLCLSDPRCSRAVSPGRSLRFHTTLGWTRPISSPLTRVKGVGAVTASRHQLPPADPQGPFPACESSGPCGGAGQAPRVPAGALPFCWKAAPQTGKQSYITNLLSFSTDAFTGQPCFRFKEGFAEKPPENCNSPTEIIKRLVVFDLKDPGVSKECVWWVSCPLATCLNVLHIVSTLFFLILFINAAKCSPGARWGWGTNS